MAFTQRDEEFEQNGGKILSFFADNKFYAFLITDVTDIIEIPEITFIPTLPPYISGMMNHRGKAIPVIDFRARMAMPKVNYTDRSCVIVVEINSHQAGIVVDRVSDVEDITPEMIARSPVEGGTVKFFISESKKRISLLDPERVVRDKG